MSANERSFQSKEDLISKLPDELLARILSFMDTQSAVATTFVSKRWNRLWISVPNLNFVDFVHEHPAGKARFDRFVDRVLTDNKVRYVRNIYFHDWDSTTQISRLNSWLASFARRDAEKIALALRCQNYTMPDCFFNSESLVELYITHFICKVPRGSASFPSLRKIHFQLLRLRDNHSLMNLLSGCPVLKHLILAVSEWDDPTRTTLEVRSSSLLALVIRVEDRLKAFYYKVVIDAPNVTTLELTDHPSVNYDIRRVSSFMDIMLRFTHDGQVLCELLKRMVQVRELTLSFEAKTSFKGSFENMPMFRNLIMLKTEIVKDEYWLCVFRLFHCAPNLVTFDFHEWDDRDVISQNPIWEESNEVPRCFATSLKRVDMVLSRIENVNKTVQMISYILKNATVLKHMYVCVTDIETEQENEFRATLSTLRKGSAECQVIYEDWLELANRVNGVIEEPVTA